MAAREDFLVALLLGIGPALVLLWASLRRFDRPFVDHTLFDDRRVFGALAVGMVFGVASSVINFSIFVADFAGSVLLLAGIILFEELFKLIYLNRRGYRERFDTTFYGIPLGVGIASTSVVATVTWAIGADLYSPIVFGLVVLFSISLTLVHADTGGVVGFGASRGDLWRSFARALLIRYAHIVFLVPFFLAAGRPASPDAVIASVLGLVTSIAFAAIVYGYVYAIVLPGTLPEDLRREMRRAKRARSVKP